MNRKDIILIMSDQHNAHYTSLFGENSELTPNLETISKGGTLFSNAYCNAPLCVPSRMSFLTGKLPSETKILDNDSVLNSDEITLAHKISLNGYETILIGRMHFKGPDQFHGFDKRYVGDITTQYWGQKRSDISEFHKSFKAKGSQEIYGTGYSPVLDFDQQVFETALKVISEKSEKPRFIVIGFYAPHFPYISKTEPKFDSEITEDMILERANDYYSEMVQKTTLKRVNRLDSIYKEMIHEIDDYVGMLYKKMKKESVFIYTSDHGDQLGRKGIFGKKVMYQDSIKIPLVIEGLFKEGHEPKNVSLIDLHHWLVKYSKSQEKLSFRQDENTVVQQVIEKDNVSIWTEASIKDNYKLVRIGDELELYDISNEETKMDITSNKDLVEALKESFQEESKVNDLLSHYSNRREIAKVLNEHGKNRNLDSNTTFEIKSMFEIHNGIFKKEED